MTEQEKNQPFKNATVEVIGEAVYNIPDIPDDKAQEIVKAYNEWLSGGASFVVPENLVLMEREYTPEEKAFRDKHKLTLCGE